MSSAQRAGLVFRALCIGTGLCPKRKGTEDEKAMGGLPAVRFGPEKNHKEQTKNYIYIMLMHCYPIIYGIEKATTKTASNH